MTLLTKDQVLRLLMHWSPESELPKKGMRLIIAHPPKSDVRLTVIAKTAVKSTYKKPLYAVVHCNTVDQIEPQLERCSKLWHVGCKL